MLDLCTLGTGGAIPLPERALSSLYVRTGGKALLIDCGEGTQTQIRRLGWGFKNIDALLLTHYHADHCGGLPGFLLSMAKTNREEPLAIYGPPGLRRVVEALRVIAPQLPYELILHELPLQETAFTAAGLEITAFPLDHGVPCLGYDLRLTRRPAFDAVKAQALGVPMPLWKGLQLGEPAVWEGHRVEPEQVCGAPRKGLHVLYATDTRPVPAIPRLGAGADLLLLEGMYDAEEKHPLAVKNHHMLYREAAALAGEAGAYRLVLTHFSNSIEDPSLLLDNARAVFPETEAAADLSVFTLEFPGRKPG